MKKALFIYALTLTSYISPVMAQDYPLSVQAVYGATGKEQVDFDPSNTNIRSLDAYYMDDFFELTDEMVRAKYFMTNAFNLGNFEKHFENEYTWSIENFMTSLSERKAPSDTLGEVKTLVTEAIFSQFQFFADLKEEYKGQTNIKIDWNARKFDKNIETSHVKLQEAATLLTQTYMMEREQNKEAFIRHLDALDFK